MFDRLKAWLKKALTIEFDEDDDELLMMFLMHDEMAGD